MLGVPELLLVLAVLMLVMGTTKLPKLARALGQSRKEFESGLTDRSGDA